MNLQDGMGSWFNLLAGSYTADTTGMLKQPFIEVLTQPREPYALRNWFTFVCLNVFHPNAF